MEFNYPHKIGAIHWDGDTGQRRLYMTSAKTGQRIRVRHRVAYGGRDSAKSHTFAGTAVLAGATEPLRFGCFREVQKSIKDSVHQLLCDKIAEYNLGGYYEVLQNEIRGPNGTTFGFSGLSNLTVFSIKSWEGLDVAWIEEAQSVAKRSMQILTPTIRKPGSEIWVTFNPEMETDYIYQRYVIDPPDDALVVLSNYSDNPWSSEVLSLEREEMRAKNPDDFAHVYLGQCRPAVDGAIYYNEVSALKSSNRWCSVPYDPLLKVHRVWDLGFNDYMSILLVQKQASGVRIIGYIEDRLRTYDSYITEMNELKYNWGKDYIPHDGRARSPESGRSPEMILQALGCTVEIVEDIGLENGIKAARQMFPRVCIDKTKAGELVSRLGRYRRRLNKETGQATTPVHDDESHGADGFRYLAVCEPQMSNDTYSVPKNPFAAFKRTG